MMLPVFIILGLGVRIVLCVLEGGGGNGILNKVWSRDHVHPLFLHSDNYTKKYLLAMLSCG
jgi:hypothetical protein